MPAASPALRPRPSAATHRLARLVSSPSPRRLFSVGEAAALLRRDVAAAQRAVHRTLTAVANAPAATRAAVLLLSSVLLGVATALLLRAGLGAGPYDVLVGGVAASTPLSHGAAAVTIGVTIVAAAALGARRAVGPGTLVIVAVVGPSVDGALAVIPDASHPLVAAAMLLSSLAAIAAAVSLMIAARLGVGVIETAAITLQRFGASARWSRTGFELAATVVGWAVGGPGGAATVLVALFVGQAVAWAVPTATR